MAHVRKLEEEVKQLKEEVEILKKDIKFYKEHTQKISISESELADTLNKRQVQHEAECKRHSAESKARDEELQRKEDEIQSLKQKVFAATGNGKKRSKGKFNSKEKLQPEPVEEDDTSVTDHQLRAYKRQVDDLRQKLESQKENSESRIKLLQSEVHKLKVSLEQMKTSCSKYESERRQMEDSIQQYQIEIEVELTNIQHLRGKLNEAAIAKATIPHPTPVINQTPSFDDSLLKRETEEYTRKADKALQELEIIQQTSRVYTSNVPLTTPVAVQGDYQVTPPTRPVYSDRQQPQQHHDYSSVPLDPNLVCPKCQLQFRFGEIQKLRRHINEECTVANFDYR